MKRVYCEMCGSSDLLKEDGVFVCQSCGCKYSLEEARKMMVEIDGTVDVSGSTIKVDNSAFVEKYLANARRAKEKEDWEEVEKYYNLVEQNDPDNIEAIFYSSYAKAKSSLIDADIYKRQAAFNVLRNSISVIDDHYKPDRKQENKKAIMSMAQDLAAMIHSDFVYTKKTDGYGFVTDNRWETYALFGNLIDGFKESIDNIQKVDDQKYLHEALIFLFKSATLIAWTNQNTNSILYRYLNEEESELKALRIKLANDYWNDHLQERNELESEQKDLEHQIEQLQNQLNEMEEYRQKKELEVLIPDLKYKQFGAMLKKKKQAIEEQITEAEAKLAEYNTVLSPIETPLNEAAERLEKVNEILEWGPDDLED